jgi:hypothetical protein
MESDRPAEKFSQSHSRSSKHSLRLQLQFFFAKHLTFKKIPASGRYNLAISLLPSFSYQAPFENLQHPSNAHESLLREEKAEGEFEPVQDNIQVEGPGKDPRNAIENHD